MPLERQEYSDIRESMRPGDVIAFGGKELFSTIIKGVTGSETVTHVGIIVQSTYRKLSENSPERDFINMIMESGKYRERLCVFQELLSVRLQQYDGEMWWLRLREDIRERIDSEAFVQFLFLSHGRPYDIPQAIRAGMDFADESGWTLNNEDFSRFFCSELVAAALEEAGVLEDINASEVTPIDLCRYQIYNPTYVVFNGEEKEIEGFNSDDRCVSEG